MRPLAIVGIALVLATSAASCSRGPRLVSRPANAGRSLVIRNVRVFDAPQAALLPGLHDVTVSDGRIAAVEPAGANATGTDLPTLDGNGGTLLPGLIDVHSHVGSSAEPPGRFALPDVDANLAAFLYAGVTTALDLGGLSPDLFRVRDGVATRKQLGPRLYVAGPMFTARGGHPVEMLRPSLPWFLRWYVIPRATREIDDAAAGAAAVQALLPEHPDVLKIMVDAGVGDVPRLSAETFAAITAAGHAAGVRSITHVTAAADALLAVQNGTDALAHMPALDEVTDEIAATIAAAHVPVVATLAIWSLISVDQPPRAAGDFLPIEREVAGPDLLQRIQSLNQDPTPFQRAVTESRDVRRRSFTALRRAGVTVLAGSDACNPTDLPGAGLHRELRTMVEYGMTPGEALRAATVDNARFLAGPNADFGTLAVGRRADLVLVAGDPTAHIEALGQIAAVVLDGTVLTRHVPR